MNNRRPASGNFLEITSQSAIEHLIHHRPKRIQRIVFYANAKQLSPRLQELHDEAIAARVGVELAGRQEKAESPIKAIVSPFDYTDLKGFLENAEETKHSLILALDHLQDPQNFGALCRTAEGLGVTAIVIPKDRGVTVTAGVYNASVGAVETIPIILVSNLGDALRKLKDVGYWVVGTTLAPDATDPDGIPDFGKAVLVMGAELEGLSPTLEKICDWKTRIPLVGKVQSLNVSVAGAILMYDLTKKIRAAARRTP